MTDLKNRSPRDPNPWYRGSKRFGDLGRHAPPGDELENTRDHERLWAEVDAIRGRQKKPTSSYHIKLFGDSQTVSIQDERFIWSIEGPYGGDPIALVETYITTPSSSGPVTVQLRNVITGLNLLLVPAVIDVGLYESYKSAVQSQIDFSAAALERGVRVSVDIDANGTDAKGLGIRVWHLSDLRGGA